MAGFPTKPKRSDFKNGTFMGGVGGSGTSKHVRKEEKAAQSTGYNMPGGVAVRGAKVGRTAPGTGDLPKGEWRGRGDDKRYVGVPDPIKDKRVHTKNYKERSVDAAKAGVDAGTSRNAPGRPGRAPKKADVPAGAGDGGRPAPGKGADAPKDDTQSGGAASGAKSGGSGGASKPSKSAPALPGTLNYFMRMTMKDGRKNQRNRAYQMFKNYKKTGKLPGDMGSATQ
jgi:hypothetical protein